MLTIDSFNAATIAKVRSMIWSSSRTGALPKGTNGSGELMVFTLRLGSTLTSWRGKTTGACQRPGDPVRSGVMAGGRTRIGEVRIRYRAAARPIGARLG